MNTSSNIATRRGAIDDLDRAIVDLSARINACTYELLVLIREFDERAGFLQWGLGSCAEWLHWRCDLSLSAAREKVRAAHALKCLPQMSEAFARGTLSYSKVRALTRVATPEDEAVLLAFALPATAACVEERCRQMRNVEPASLEESERLHRQRALRVFRDEDRGMLTFTVELPREQGELLCRALDKAVADYSADGAEFADESWHAQQADARVTLACSYLSGESGTRHGSADAYQVLIHVYGTALCEGQGRSDLPIESVRRLTCDGSLVTSRTGSTASRSTSAASCGRCRRRSSERSGRVTAAAFLPRLRAHALRRRPDGRAIPAHGYRPEDMTDEENPSAEGWLAELGTSAAVSSPKDHPPV